MSVVGTCVQLLFDNVCHLFSLNKVLAALSATSMRHKQGS